MKFCLLCLGLALLPAAAHADISADDILSGLSAVKIAQAHFTETRRLAVLTEPVVSKGTLIYIAPDTIEKDTVAPKQESVTVRGDKLTMTDEDGTHTIALTDMPEIGTLVTAVRATLQGDKKALAQHYTITARGDEVEWVLLLQPNEPNVKHMILYVRLTGSHDNLTEVEIKQTNGDESDMQIVPDKR